MLRERDRRHARDAICQLANGERDLTRLVAAFEDCGNEHLVNFFRGGIKHKTQLRANRFERRFELVALTG